MENLKLTYRKNGDYFIPNLVLENEEDKNYQIGKYGYLRLDYLRNYKKGEYELMKIFSLKTPYYSRNVRINNVFGDDYSVQGIKERIYGYRKLETMPFANYNKKYYKKITCIKRRKRKFMD